MSNQPKVEVPPNTGTDPKTPPSVPVLPSQYRQTLAQALTDGNGLSYQPPPWDPELPTNLYAVALNYLRTFPGGRLNYRDPGESGKGAANCSEFIIAVLKHAGLSTNDPQFLQALALNFKFTDLPTAVKGGDPRTKGAVWALTKQGLAHEVGLSEVIRNPNGNYQGMLVQYWNNAGTEGHTGFVKSIENLPNGEVQMTLFGSNKQTEGTGEIRVNLSRQKYVYFARMNGS